MTKRVVVAIVGSFPVAVVAAVSLGLAINLGGAVSTLFFWMVWGASTYHAVRELEPNRVFGRTAVAYAVAAFTLPVTAAVFAVTAFGAFESSMSDAEGALEGFIGLIFGAALVEIFVIIAVIVGVFGVVTGVVAILLARSFLRRQDTEPQQSTESSTPAVGPLLSAPAALRRFATGGLRQVRLENKATVLGLGLVALFLAIIAGIAVYGILASTDTPEPPLTVAPTPNPTRTSKSAPTVPAISTPNVATAAEPTPNRTPEPTNTPLPRATPYQAGDSDLNRAIQRGDVEDVQAIIDSGRAVNVSDADGNSFIHGGHMERPRRCRANTRGRRRGCRRQRIRW